MKNLKDYYYTHVMEFEEMAHEEAQAVALESDYEWRVLTDFLQPNDERAFCGSAKDLDDLRSILHAYFQSILDDLIDADERSINIYE